ncbi:SMI1/KNR4 family protein [Streptomyces stramineus]|uniref:Knr4/Smi1-like domain-containing protein n=1 Tax=Streptomyces stramineus TaxID=173861 RepID=A0ABN1AWC3_9ACTN
MTAEAVREGREGREGPEGREGGAARSAFDAVRRLMPPHENAGERVDWEAAERLWGTGFPADYVAFMAEYGEGTVQDFLHILQPLPSPYWTDPDDGMRAETVNARGFLRNFSGPPGLTARSPAPVLAWGVTAGPDILCWQTTDEDPDRWPVVVIGRHTPEPVSLHDRSMTGFLRGLFLAEFDRCPLSGTQLWGRRPKFLHCREEQRLWDAGIDPWAGAPGEPDPHAGPPLG